MNESQEIKESEHKAEDVWLVVILKKELKMSQTIIVASLETLIKYSFRSKAKILTTAVWPIKILIHSKEVSFHILIELSRDPLTIKLFGKAANDHKLHFHVLM